MAVGSPFFWQWEHLPLAVGTYTASGNSLLAVGMPLCILFPTRSHSQRPFSFTVHGSNAREISKEGILLFPRWHVSKVYVGYFHDMVEKTMGVFMDDFSVFGNSFENCLSHLDKMLQRSLMPVSFGPPSTRMPTSLSKTVTRTNDKEKFHNVMRCLKTPSKFVKSFTFGALTLWARSRLHEGTNIFSWPLIICQNGLKRKRSPPMMPELFASFLNLFARFGAPRAIVSDHGTHFYNYQFAKVMLKYGVTHRLSTTYHPQTSGQVEVSNRGLKRILERTIGENHASWSDKLDDAL
nr:reverse transcriptase domain-containing protein [Tanacetum cinerariifolium]